MRDRNPKVAEIPFNSTNKYQVWLDCWDRKREKKRGGQKWGEWVNRDSIEESEPTEIQQKEGMGYI